MSKMKFGKLFAISAGVVLAGCVYFQRDPDLVFHCTFDGDASIRSPKAGSAGTIAGATYREGKIGKALYVPAKSAVATFPFPEGLPTEQGTIEFWGKIEDRKEVFSHAGDPYMFSFVNSRGGIVFEFHFNSNNGSGKSGIIFGLPGGDGCASYVGGSRYSAILGSEDTFGWHHYEVSWNSNGFGGCTCTEDNIILIVDGVKRGGCKSKAIQSGKLRQMVKGPLTLVFSDPKGGGGIGNSSFSIDEFRVWRKDRPM